MTKHSRPKCPADQVVQIAGKFYFNSIELRSKALEMRDRIVGLHKRKNMSVWHLSCTTPNCDGVCVYSSGYDEKGIDYSRCSKCKSPEMGKSLRKFIDQEWREKIICHSTVDTNTVKPKYYVQCSTCTSLYRATQFTGRQNRMHCSKCHRKYRTLFGQYVASDKIWAIRHLLRGATLRENNGKFNVSWQIQCPTQDCSGQLEYRNGSSSVCVICRASARAHAPFAALYKSHKRQDAARVRRQPKYVASQLTFSQFQEAMKNDKCHYCGDTVPRHPRSARYTSDGKRMTSCVYLDRLDSSKPYAVGNVVTCCVSCNIIKGAYLTEDEMLYIAASRRGDAARANKYHAKLRTPYQFHTAKAIGRRPSKKSPTGDSDSEL